jgi:hypothetical protein
MSHLHSHLSPHLNDDADDELFFFFAAVILAAPSVSVSNSIVKLLHKLADLLKLPDLLILIFMKIASFSASQPVLRLSSVLPLQSLCEIYFCQAGF